MRSLIMNCSQKNTHTHTHTTHIFPPAAVSGSEQPKESRSRVGADSSQRQARPGRPSPRPHPKPAHRYVPVPAWPGHALALHGQRLVGRPRRACSTSGGPTLFSHKLVQPAGLCARRAARHLTSCTASAFLLRNRARTRFACSELGVVRAREAKRGSHRSKGLHPRVRNRR